MYSFVFMQSNQIMFKYRSAFFSLLTIVFLSSFSGSHPFYVSVSEIRIDSEKQYLNISSKMFTDDLQEALYKLYKIPVDLFDVNEENEKLLSKYLKERMKVKVGNNWVDLVFVGYENIDDATWCYMESKESFESSKIITVENILLFDFLSGQSNLMHCFLDKSRKSYKLNYPKRSVVFEF